MDVRDNKIANKILKILRGVLHLHFYYLEHLYVELGVYVVKKRLFYLHFSLLQEHFVH